MTTSNFCILEENIFSEVRQENTTGNHSLFAKKLFLKDELISPFFAGDILEQPTYLTVQVGHDKHITLRPQFLQYINHSCNPNAFFNTTNYQLIALRDIQEGEEIVFFYPSTEWEMSQPFQCHCNQPNCLGLIKGASQIDTHILEEFQLTDFIKNKILEKKQHEYFKTISVA